MGLDVRESSADLKEAKLSVVRGPLRGQHSKELQGSLKVENDSWLTAIYKMKINLF